MSDVLSTGDEQLFRQVHPAMVGEDGLPARTAFTPSKKDAGLLSTLRGRVGPEEAFRRHVQGGLRSVGTWACTVAEVEDAECRAVDDAEDLGVADHASIDFTALSGAAQKRAARKLREAAVKRGCRYQPPSGEGAGT